MTNFLLLIILINCSFYTIRGDYSLLELESSEDEINYADLNISTLGDVPTNSTTTSETSETTEIVESSESESESFTPETTTTSTTKTTSKTTTTTLKTVKPSPNKPKTTPPICKDDSKVLECLSNCSDPAQFIHQLDHCAFVYEKIDQKYQSDQIKCQQDVRDQFNMSIGECSLRCKRDPEYYICSQECSKSPYIARPLFESKYCHKKCSTKDTNNTTTSTSTTENENTTCLSECLKSKDPQDCLDFCEKDPVLEECLEMCQNPQVLAQCIENCTQNQEDQENQEDNNQFSMDNCVLHDCKRNCTSRCYEDAQENHCIHYGIPKKFGMMKSCKWNVDLGQYRNKELPNYHNVRIFKTYFDEIDGFTFGRDESDQLENPFDNGIVLGFHDDAAKLDQDRDKYLNVTHIYLDYNMVVTFDFSFSTYNLMDLHVNSINRLKISKIGVAIDEYDEGILKVEHEKVPKPAKSLVKYYVRIQLNNNVKLSQTLSGDNLKNLPLLFHLKGIHASCSSNDPSNPPNTVSAMVHIGCPPSTNIRFNWNESVNSIKINDQYEKYGTSDHCWKGRTVCFYKESPIVLHFEIFDNSIQNYTLPYEGKFMMRVIAGGYNENDLRMFDRDEVKRYNFPGVSNSALIWSLEDEKELNESMHNSSLIDGDYHELILVSGKSKIRWVCNAFSPCAKIIPRWTGQTIYYLRIKMSNKKIEENTLCLHEHEFTILLYGFKPSSEIMLIAICVFSTLFIITLLIMYLCTRNEKVVWLRSKYRLHRWFKMIFSIFPKPSKSEHPDLFKERRNKVLLSLQGHLKVPVITKSDKTRSKERITKNRKKSFYKRQEMKEEEEKMKSWMDQIYNRMMEKKLNDIITEQNEKKLKIGSGARRKNKSSHVEAADVEKDNAGEGENNEDFDWNTADEETDFDFDELAQDKVEKDVKDN